MNAADGSSSSAAAAHQLLGGVVTQLSKGDPLSDSFSRHATAAVLGQQAVRALDAAAQPSKLHGTFQKVLELVLKRLSKGQVSTGVGYTTTAAAAAASDCWVTTCLLFLPVRYTTPAASAVFAGNCSQAALSFFRTCFCRPRSRRWPCSC